MKFDELDKKMRMYETGHDFCVLPGIIMVSRLDGRNFTRLTKEVHNFESPFDERFRDMMMQTTAHLMNCGFSVVYGYTQSDEISLLFALNESAFNRKTRKYHSVLAGEASAKLSNLLGDVASFDCRISQLPSTSDVVDYFRWRNEDAHRNALNAHCYWKLREVGRSAKQATSELLGMSVSDKNELLFTYGINFNDLPSWQKRGIGLYWEEYKKEGYDPQTDETVKVLRRRVRIELELPMKELYSQFIKELVSTTHSEVITSIG